MSILDLTRITVKKLLPWIKVRNISLAGDSIVVGDIFINMNMQDGDLTGEPYDRTAKILILVAHKEKDNT